MQTFLSPILALLACLCPYLIQAQEETLVIEQGKRYIDFNIRSLEKYNQRVSKQQDRLLSKLQRQEKRYAAKLKRKDSAAYVRYQQQPVSYDSINKLSKDRSKINTARTRASSSIDSLTSIQKYLQQKLPIEGGNILTGYDEKLSALKNTQNGNSYINDLINQRTNILKSINASTKGISNFRGIEKQVFYAKEKMKVFKQMSDEPSKLEEEAMEILQGQEGFEQFMNKASGRTMGNGATNAADLEKMGYQTKRMMNEQLQQKFGNNLGGLQQNMSKQISDYQDKLKDLKAVSSNTKQVKQSAKKLTNLQKPSFKVNPMRGLPLSKRIEKQWNFQTNRATIDGKPAILQLSAMAGFKHTPKLSYGLGVAGSIGLGQNWNNIRLSFEGIGLRSYAEWQLLYGFGAYAGYERMFKRATFLNTKEALQTEKQTLHNTQIYNESVMLGITKRYQINNKLNGSMQILYDIWWKEKGLRTPIQLRITTLKN